MSTAARHFTVETHAEPLPATAFDRLLLPLLLLVAWLTFELTANATLSLVLACLRFGMNDFRTARWLWQWDPYRSRARACAAFYAASGVWKTAIVPLFIAGTISIVWAVIAPQAMQRAHPITQQLFLALSVGMWAAAILIILAAAAVLLSLTAQWRVWVHPNLHRSRQEQCWPPRFNPVDQSATNQAILILLTAVFAAIVIGPVIAMQTVKLIRPPMLMRHLLELFVVFGFPVLGALCFGLMRSKLFAISPWECWPESIRELSTDYQLISRLNQDIPHDR